MAELPDKRLADGPMPAPELRGDMAADAWEFAQSTAQKGPATIRVESPPQAFIDGAKAYTAGKPLHANSFSTHPDRGCADSESDPYLAWEDGWKMARAIDRRQQAERGHPSHQRGDDGPNAVPPGRAGIFRRSTHRRQSVCRRTVQT